MFSLFKKVVNLFRAVLYRFNLELKKALFADAIFNIRISLTAQSKSLQEKETNTDTSNTVFTTLHFLCNL